MHKIKSLLSVVALSAALFRPAVGISADTSPRPSPQVAEREPAKELNFNARELSLDLFEATSAKDLTGDVDYGGGIGANYFFTRGFGAGARVIAWNTTDRFVDEISARLIARAPLWDRVAPYGYVEGLYNCAKGRFKDGDWGAGAGGGLEIALAKYFHLKGEAGLRVQTNGKGEFIGTAGITIPFTL